MSDRLRSRNAQIGVAVAGGLVILAAVWFLVVGPQRSKANELATQVSVTQAELTQRRLELDHPSASVTVKPSDLYRLTKALPDEVDMSGVLLDVNRTASSNGLTFQSITPAPQVTGLGYLQQPIAVVVQGRFGDVSSFLGDLRTLVGVRDGRLDARGRLYSVSKVEITSPDNPATFPIVKASVTLNAYTYSAPAPPTTPDPSTTTDTSSSGTVAAGATP